jgi:hypothetical protein
MEDGRPRPSIVSGARHSSRQESQRSWPRGEHDHNIVKNLRMRSNPRPNSAIVVA